jgi:hypothetical protein
MAIDTTPGGAAADGYVSEADADAYHLTRVDNDAWDTADTATKETAIKNATRLLDLLQWKGSKTFESGSLRWPREGVYDLDGLLVDEQIIPGWLENATAEYAFVLLRDGDVTATPGSAGLERVKVDVIELEFDTERSNATQKAQGTPDSVLAMVAPYLSGSPFTLRVIRT